MNANKVNVLSMYRKLLKSVRKLQTPDCAKKTQQIRDCFRSSINERDPEKIKSLIFKAQSSLGYMKIVSPRRKSDGETGRTRIVYGDKAGSEGTVRKAYSNWTGKNMDPDSVAKHYQLLNRAGFRDNKHAKGDF